MSALSTLPAQARALLTTLTTTLTTRPIPTAVAFFTLLLLRRTASDYSAWRSLGKGGIPSNPFGYLLAQVGSLFASWDLVSTHQYLPKLSRSKRFLESDLPVRAGAAPAVSRWIAPVRQLQAQASADLLATLGDMLDRVVATTDGAIKGLSQIEGGSSDALWLETSTSVGVASKSSSKGLNGKRELYHFHGSEGSAHVFLSAADAKAVLDAGWGERHPLSGRLPGSGKTGIPDTYVMIYAPRSEEEVTVHEKIARASAGFAKVGGI